MGSSDLMKSFNASGEQTHFCCCICFEWYEIKDAFTDGNGVKWDMCWQDGIREELYKASHG